jgi:hypothetical protein
MKIIFDGTHVRFEGSKGKPLGQTRAGLPKKRVAWTALIMLKDAAGNAIEAPWSTPKRHRMNCRGNLVPSTTRRQTPCTSPWLAANAGAN